MQNTGGGYWVTFEISWMGLAAVGIAAAAAIYAVRRLLIGIARANGKSN
jgi:hypothetical protein